MRAVEYLMKYTDLGMQSEQDQIDDDLLGVQEKEFYERKDSQPIEINADQNRASGPLGSGLELGWMVRWGSLVFGQMLT